MNNNSLQQVRNRFKPNFYHRDSRSFFISQLLSLILVVCLFIGGCSLSSSNSLLTGDYQFDTRLIINSFSKVIDIPTEETGQVLAQEEADALIGEYIARYRRDPDYAETGSFMAIGSALNELAGFYHSYPSRPLPQDFKERLKQQFEQANIALKRELD